MSLQTEGVGRAAGQQTGRLRKKMRQQRPPAETRNSVNGSTLILFRIDFFSQEVSYSSGSRGAKRVVLVAFEVWMCDVRNCG